MTDGATKEQRTRKAHFARTIDELPECVRFGLESYYQKDYLPLLTTVTDDVMFIGAGPDVVQGKRALMAACGEDIPTPSCRMSNARFTVMPLGFTSAHARDSSAQPDLALVTGFYDLMSECDKPMLTAAHQRISLLARFERGAWRAFHIHSSNEWGELVDDEVFPVQTSMQTYEYVKHIIEQADRLPRPEKRARVRIAVGRDVVSIDQASLLYVRAEAKTCEARTPHDVISIPCSLGALEELLDEAQFRRVHRSFLVNRDAVVRMEGCSLVLSNGERIPVPRRRRSEIHAWILSDSPSAAGGGISETGVSSSKTLIRSLEPPTRS